MNLPATQSVQAKHVAAFGAWFIAVAAAVFELKVRRGQAVHTRLVVALGVLLTEEPSAQSIHGWHAVAGLPSWSQFPLPQVTAAAAPPAQYWPATHAAHMTGVVGVAAAVWCVPAEHRPTGVHALVLDAVEYVPVGQLMQTWLAIALPAVEIYWLAGHAVQAVHVAALLPRLNWPVAHPVQTRSAISVPAVPTNVPAPHVRQVVHMVALSAALNVPALQAVHVRSCAALPWRLT
jgi:hypothetical protein